ISGFDKFTAFVGSFFNRHSAFGIRHSDDTAAILFTSGSEGVPKGVELTHRNLLANIRQILAKCDLLDSDRFFNAMPLFHSFGLTAGLVLPLVRGNYIFIYPSPLHYRVVPTVFYDKDCTVLFGTNTFLNGYGRKAHPYDFRSLRYLFAGAEKLQQATAELWAQKFGVRVFEGYGATECSPCISATTPLEPKHGTAGRFLPGIEHRLEPVEGVTDPAPAPVAPAVEPAAGQANSAANPPAAPGTEKSAPPTAEALAARPVATGRLFVRGPNVMKGYLNAEANAKFQAGGGWYDTGDIVSVDTEGFVSIRGRMKRFAKISGEMVSLTAVEDALAGAFPHYGFHCQTAVITRSDEAKGEALICCTNEPKLTAAEIRDAIKARGLSNLCVPREIVVVKEIPKLGTGKVNHRELQTMVQAPK
ncbi:MAG: AMP-binding protein, partial [Limisphaerales bacterium]